MKDLLKKYRKFFIIGSLLVLLSVFVSLYFVIKINFQEAVKLSLKNYAKLNVEFDNMKIGGLNKVNLENFILKNKEGKTLVISENTEIVFGITDLLFKSDKKIDIIAQNAVINFEMYKAYKNNFLEEFTRKKTGKKSNRKFLKQIIVKDSILDFRDFSKEEVIYKRLRNFNGKIKFNNSGFTINVSGEQKKEKYLFALKKAEKLSMILNLKDIEINNKVAQYAFKDDNLDYKSGRLGLKLNYDNNKISVNGKVNNGKVLYKDINNEIEDVNGSFTYENDILDLNLRAVLDNEDVKFDLNYENGETKFSVGANNFYYSWLENYKLLKDLKLDVKGKIELGVLNFKLDREGEIFLDIKSNSKRLLFMEKLLNNVNADIVFENNQLKFKHLKCSLEDEYIETDINLNAIIDPENLEGDIELSNINFYINEENLKGKYKLDLKKQELSLKLNSENNVYNIDYNIVNNKAKLRSLLGDETLFEYNGMEFFIKGTAECYYDLNKSIINSGDFDLRLFDFFSYEKVNLKGDFNENKINLEKIYLSDQNDYIYSDGYFDLNDYSYNINIRQSQFNLKKVLENLGIKNSFDIRSYVSGVLKGKNQEYRIKLNINSSEGEFGLNYNGLKGNIAVEKKDEFDLEAKLTAKEIYYSKLIFKDVDIVFGVENDKLKIKKLGNKLFKLKGIYDLKNKESDIVFSLKDYYAKEFLIKEDKLSFFIENIEGKLSGNIMSPDVSLDVSKAVVDYNNEKFTLGGALNYSDFKISADKFKIDNNILNGNLNFLKKEFDLKLNILENNYKKLYNVKTGSNALIEKINFRILGEINLWGKFNDFKSSGKLNFDSVYYEGTKCPNIRFKFSYNKGDLYNLTDKGMINFKEIKLFNDLKEDIIKAKGNLNFENKRIDLRLENEIVDVSRLSDLTKEKLKGLAKVDAVIEGDLRNLSYQAKLSSNRIDFYNYILEDLETEIKGDKDGVSLKTFNMLYNGNAVNAKGDLKLNPFDYNLKVEAQEIDLAGLGFLLKDKIKDLEGKARVNINLSRENSRGLIALDSLKFSDLNENLLFKNVESRIDLEDNKFYLRYLKGDINKGKISSDGILYFGNEISNNLKDRFLPSNWSFNYELQDLDYRIGKHINLVLSSKGKLTEKDLRGNLIIKEGELRGIESSNEENELLKKINIYLDLEVKKEFKVAFENISVIQEIEARVEGNGTIKIEDGDMNFLGTLSTDKGVITFNNNDFEIESGVMVFEDPYQIFPDVNPSLALSAVTNIAGEEIYVRILGDLKNPQAELDSATKGINGEKLSDTEIITLLAFHNKMDFSQTEGSDILEELLARQLKNQIFNPISSKLEKILKIPKIDISPNISIKGSNEEQANSVIEFGGKLELADIPFFYEELFLNFGMEYSEDENQNSVYKYDAKLDYRFRENSSLFLEANKTQEEDSSNTTEDQLELRIGFQFIRRFNFFDELIKEK